MYSAFAARHADEINSLKQRYAREKSLADEQYERTRRISTDNLLEEAARVRESEKDALSDLVNV